MRTRITAVAVAVVAVLLVVGAFGTLWMLDRVLTEQTASQLDDDLDAVAEAFEERGARSIAQRDDDLLVALHADGRVVVNDDDAARLPPAAPGRGPTETIVDDEPVLMLSEEVDGGTVVVARSVEHVGDAIAAASLALAVSIPIAVALIGLVVGVVAARALVPVERIRRQVDQVGAESLDQRVPRSGSGDEIDRLASTMNRMLDRVEEGYRSRQRFVSDASHELRSPLATMRQYAELSRAHPRAAPPGELADVVIAEGSRMQEIVEGLLLLARLDEGAVREAEPAEVDLDDLLLSETGRVRALGSVAVDGSGVGPARVLGDATLLARAVRNLVDNAVRHARGRIALSSGVEGGAAVIHVDDDGDGVPESERERVFERFTRLDEARSREAGGSGLGLAIVREIVRSHGGAVGIEVGPLGGARFAVRLPALSDAGPETSTGPGPGIWPAPGAGPRG